jgi:hypothetical protein
VSVIKVGCLLSRPLSVITETSAPINFSLLLSQAHVVSRPTRNLCASIDTGEPAHADRARSRPPPPHAVPLEDGLPRESSVSVNTAMSVNTIVAGSAQNPKLVDRVRALIRTKHYSIKTERIYVFWIRHFVRFHGKRGRSSWKPVAGSIPQFIRHACR